MAAKTIIGVIHLPPLPGYAASPGLDAVIEKALRDQEAFEAGGVHGILVENEDDQPHRVESAAETTAVMTRVTRELVLRARTAEIGVEILLNDPCASLAVALASGARFIRTDYFVDRMSRPEYGGEMRIDPVGLMAFRERIGARHVKVHADVQVKYATMLESRTLMESAALAREHRADGIVVTGTVTGQPPTLGDLRGAKQGAGPVPILVGSGLDSRNARELLSIADGGIVGTSLKTGAYVDADKVRRLMDEVRALG